MRVIVAQQFRPIQQIVTQIDKLRIAVFRRTVRDIRQSRFEEKIIPYHIRSTGVPAHDRRPARRDVTRVKSSTDRFASELHCIRDRAPEPRLGAVNGRKRAQPH